MRSFNKLFAVPALTVAMLLTSVAQAAKTYQVTGVITKLTDKLIIVQKTNDEKWEIDRDDSTKVTGTLKEGSKVTIEYKMSAAKIEVKDAK